MENLPASQTNGFQLSSEEQAARVDHRVWIAGRVLTLLSHYWRDDDSSLLTEAIAADWCDVLEGIPQEFIGKACLRYARDEPRRKPTPGAIYQMARAAMPAPKIVHQSAAPPGSERELCAPDVAQRICEEAGYVPKRFGGEE